MEFFKRALRNDFRHAVLNFEVRLFINLGGKSNRNSRVRNFFRASVFIPDRFVSRAKFWGTLYTLNPFSVRMCIPGEAHPHSLTLMCIPGESHPIAGDATPGMGICLTGNSDVPPWECTSPPGMGMCLIRNVHPHWEWGCDSPVNHSYVSCVVHQNFI